MDLAEQIISLKKELKEERERNKELESKLFMYLETGMANISRNTFRAYVVAAIGRKETNVEWNHFISSFSHTGIDKSIYEWIDTFMNPNIVNIVFENWNSSEDEAKES